MVSVRDILGRWLEDNRAPKRVDENSIFERWQEIVGPTIAESTRVVDLRGGELLVEVSSAPLLTELSTYYRQEILESVRKFEEFRGIHRLRFRAGSF